MMKMTTTTGVVMMMVVVVMVRTVLMPRNELSAAPCIRTPARTPEFWPDPHKHHPTD